MRSIGILHLSPTRKLGFKIQMKQAVMKRLIMSLEEYIILKEMIKRPLSVSTREKDWN